MTRPSQLLEGPSRCLRLSCNAVSCAQQLSSTIQTQHKARKNLNRNTNKLQCNNPPVEQYSPGLSYFPQYRSKASLFSLANRRLDSAKTSTHQRTPLDDSRPPTSGAKRCKSKHQVRGWKGSSSKCLAKRDLALTLRDQLGKSKTGLCQNVNAQEDPSR